MDWTVISYKPMTCCVFLICVLFFLCSIHWQMFHYVSLILRDFDGPKFIHDCLVVLWYMSTCLNDIQIFRMMVPNDLFTCQGSPTLLPSRNARPSRPGNAAVNACKQGTSWELALRLGSCGAVGSGFMELAPIGWKMLCQGQTMGCFTIRDGHHSITREN
jgi:hypothetical protein